MTGPIVLLVALLSCVLSTWSLFNVYKSPDRWEFIWRCARTALVLVFTFAACAIYRHVGWSIL